MTSCAVTMIIYKNVLISHVQLRAVMLSCAVAGLISLTQLTAMILGHAETMAVYWHIMFP
jgi:hypothetical protein